LKKTIITVSLPMIFLLLPFVPSNRLAAQQPKNQDQEIAEKYVRSALTEQKGYKLLGEMCTMGPRLSGSANSIRVMRWAERKMKELGFNRVWMQPVMVPHWVRGDVEKAEISKSRGFNGRALNVASLGGSIGTDPAGITAGVLEVHSFEELKSAGSRANGKIIFFNRPMDIGEINTFRAYGEAVNQRTQGAIEASRAGGVGAIVRSVTTRYDNVPHVGVMYYNDSIPKVPSVAIGLEDADFLSEALKCDPQLQVHLTLDCKTLPDTQSYNLIGEITGSEKPDEIVLVGGHFDCWDKGQGAQDDGAGCMQSMEVLDLFHRLNIRPKRTIRCVFFINEENGTRGGEYYGQYADTTGFEHVAAIESDRGAATPRGFTVHGDSLVLEKIRGWLPVLQNAGIDWVRSGHGGTDISRIKEAIAQIGYVPDGQRYFDYHHSDNDVFATVDPREFELGAASMAVLVYLISEYGL